MAQAMQCFSCVVSRINADLKNISVKIFKTFSLQRDELHLIQIIEQDMMRTFHSLIVELLTLSGGRFKLTRVPSNQNPNQCSGGGDKKTPFQSLKLSGVAECRCNEMNDSVRQCYPARSNNKIN